MKCTDCGGGVPGTGWKRCEDCAIARLRTIMGGAPERSVIQRRFTMNEPVLVQPKGSEVWYPGKVARSRKGNDYTVTLENGERVYVDGSRLRERLSQTSPPP